MEDYSSLLEDVEQSLLERVDRLSTATEERLSLLALGFEGSTPCTEAELKLYKTEMRDRMDHIVAKAEALNEQCVALEKEVSEKLAKYLKTDHTAKMRAFLEVRRAARNA